ncbi:hypothetical protein NDR87_00435 [Nocardia sp. CDC159]|uniref:Uncharacterized protein n=1 Tax=Nocardia pulmonis TaxID=2951408 RepID=A0A9X2IU57_9NOCA|nr:MULTISPECIES: hypothetical protein [Nocardia]MCM6772522.1 hypothetical protein [Nocardia pulmonis]MCM6784820.1 hypothetical protein [Nocardia sp. CDC159]
MRIRSFSLLAALSTAAAALLGIGSGATASAAAPEPTLFGNLCLRAQAQTANLDVIDFRRAGGSLRNVDYPDMASFAASKPQVQPLTTTRYNTYADAGNSQPKQVRCKGKSADHIAAVYGADIAGPEADCAAVNRQTVREVAAMLTPAERRELVHRPEDVVIDPDTVAATGQEWVAEFPVALVDAAQRLHIPSKSLYVPLSTPGIPEAFKGQHYCTLISHHYLKQLMLGRVVATA